MRKQQPTLAPQQARSRESLSRLLKAAIEVLGQQGVAGATIPRIAAHAGLTPGAVYRRFRNKDVLLETAILRVLEDQTKVLQLAFGNEAAGEIPLAVLADQVVNSLVVSYRVNARLLRAVRQFVHDREGSPFWKKASKIELQTFKYLVSLFVSRGSDIQHADAPAAVGLALMMVVGTLWEVVVSPGDVQLWKGVLPKDDRTLKVEITRAFLSYLGARQRSGH